MKKCNTCQTNKAVIEFHKDRTHTDGLRSLCKDCVKHYQKTKYGKAKKATSDAKSYKKNKNKRVKKAKQYQQQNLEVYRNINARRRALKLQAVPKWLTSSQKQEIKQFYTDAAYLTQYTQTEIQVDHIIPLNSKIVCGLHVPWNLQLLTKEENCKKSNKFGGF